MSLKLRDLIRNVRACKTAAEERDVIAKECAEIRSAFKSKDEELRHRNVAKLLYIHMLGYPAHFGQMEALRLIASPRFAEKRIGYLALMLLLDENQELLMMGTNSIQHDLRNKNAHIAGLALVTLGNICSADMARDLASDVANLLRPNNHADAELRNKAALCAIRILRKVPDLAEDFAELAPALLGDKNHAVALCACTLMIEMVKISPDVLPRFRESVPRLVALLKSLWLAGYVAEYDVVGVTDPFLQCKIIQLLRVLGTGDQRASDHMGEVLAQVVINTDGSTNTGTAILYECVQTIMAIEAEGGLRVLAVNLLGKFLQHRDNNIRYVALNTLCKVVERHADAVQHHRNTVVDCLKDADISIRRRALDLIYALVTKNNVRALVKELLNYLSLTSGDTDFKADLTDKICTVVEKFAPSRRWHVETVVSVLAAAGPFIRETVPVDLIALLTRSKDLQPYAARLMLRALQNPVSRDQHPLAAVAVWALGELGEHFVSDKSLAAANEDLAASNKQAEPSSPQPAFAPATEMEVLSALEYQIVTQTFIHANVASAAPTALAGSGSATAPGAGVSGVTAETVKQLAQTALVKLYQRFGSGKTAGLEHVYAKITQLLQHHACSVSAELQQRSVEYTELAKPEHSDIHAYVLGRMPQFARLRKSDDDSLNGGSDASGAASPTSAAAAEPEQKAPAAAPVQQQPQQHMMNPMDMLHMGSATAPAATAAAPNVLDLMGSMGMGSGSTPSASPPAASPAASFDVFNFGSGAASTSASGPSVSNGVETFPARTVLTAGALQIVFTESRNTANPNVVTVAAAFNNSGSAEMTEFDMLVAVPPHIKRDLRPASSKTVPAHSVGAVTQSMTLTNEQFAEKATVIKVKVTYKVNGEPVVEQASIRDFPK